MLSILETGPLLPPVSRKHVLHLCLRGRSWLLRLYHLYRRLLVIVLWSFCPVSFYAGSSLGPQVLPCLPELSGAVSVWCLPSSPVVSQSWSGRFGHLCAGGGARGRTASRHNPHQSQRSPHTGTQAHRHTGTQVSQTSRLPPSANHAWRSCRQGCAVGVQDTRWCPYFQLGVTVFISELVIGFCLKVKLG